MECIESKMCWGRINVYDREEKRRLEEERRLQEEETLHTYRMNKKKKKLRTREN